MAQGLLYIFTGEGKGKTSAALGMATRAVCANLRVAWIAWYKDPQWAVSEYRLPELLPITMEIRGRGFALSSADPEHVAHHGDIKVAKTNTGVVIDAHDHQTHQQAAQEALQRLEELLLASSFDLIICDELCQAVGDGLVSEDQAVSVLTKRGKTHLAITGRHCPPSLIAIADTVSELRKVKHAYDTGVMAVQGLDF